MRVAELRQLLEGLPADAEVSVAAHVLAGTVTDVAPTQIVGVDQSRDDHGETKTVWLVAIGETRELVPALLTFTCRCGAVVAIHDGHEWPVEHLEHLYPS